MQSTHNNLWLSLGFRSGSPHGLSQISHSGMKGRLLAWDIILLIQSALTHLLKYLQEACWGCGARRAQGALAVTKLLCGGEEDG